MYIVLWHCAIFSFYFFPIYHASYASKCYRFDDACRLRKCNEMKKAENRTVALACFNLYIAFVQEVPLYYKC